MKSYSGFTTKLSALRDKLGSLSWTLVVAMILGMVLPALLGGGFSFKLREDQRQQALLEDLKNYSNILANALLIRPANSIKRHILPVGPGNTF